MAGATPPPPSSKSVLPRAFLFSASTFRESRRLYRSPSDTTPTKLLTRFLRGCAAAAELEGKGATAETAEERVTQSDASNWFERACKLDAHLYERVALCQKLLDATVAKEIHVCEARFECNLDVYLQQKNRKREKENREEEEEEEAKEIARAKAWGAQKRARFALQGCEPATKLKPSKLSGLQRPA